MQYRTEYDLAIVGGGLGGAALAKAMAERGARVLVLERELVFRDRVRGEAMLSWGVRDARSLGVCEVIEKSCGRRLDRWNMYVDSARVESRDLLETTPEGDGILAFHHPEMQEALLHAAAAAGAEVRRGARALEIAPGRPSVIRMEMNGRIESVRARLVIGADGRNSLSRRAADFVVKSVPERSIIAGLLFEGLDAPDSGGHFMMPSGFGQVSFVFPLGEGRCRAYFCTQKPDTPAQFSGQRHIFDFIAACRRSGAPEEWFEDAIATGPLAAFRGADQWVENPAREGIVLIGDAAAASDPTWGCGLSLTMRDVRVLRDYLSEEDDWTKAVMAYADEHDRYYGALRQIESELTALFFDLGPAADLRRSRALPLLTEGAGPDLIAWGPDTPYDTPEWQECFNAVPVDERLWSNAV